MSYTKKLALSGVFAGLALALMWIVSFVPSMDYALPAAAGMLTMLLVVEVGPSWSMGVYVVAATLALLLLPNKSAALFYAMFFGYYPALKALLERRLPVWLGWICKFAVFNGTIVSAYLLAVRVFGVDLDDFGEFGRYAELVLLATGNLAFFVYDKMVLSVFWMLYQRRWRKKLQHLLRR